MNQPAAALNLKRSFLYALIASVALSALMGIVAILSGDFGWVEVRILLTTVTIAAASICGLACGAALAAGTARALAKLGIAAVLPAAAMVILGMWLDVSEDVYWKIAASIAVFAVAFAHLALLSMAKLAAAYRWSLVAAHVIILAVAAIIVVMIMFELEEEGMFRLLGVAAIADGAITIIVPIFHRLSRADTTDDAAIDRQIAQLKQQIAELEKLKSQH